MLLLVLISMSDYVIINVWYILLDLFNIDIFHSGAEEWDGLFIKMHVSVGRS